MPSVSSDRPLSIGTAMPSLNRIRTRTTRYKAEDGKERAVLLWSDYQWLIARLEEVQRFAKKLAPKP